MLVKNRLLFVNSEEHEFDALIEKLKNDFTIHTCNCSYPDIRFYSDDYSAELVVCSLSGLERNNIIDMASCIPNMFVFCSSGDNTDISALSSMGIKYYASKRNMCEEGERFIRIVCRNMPFRYAEFREKIYKLIYDCNKEFQPGANRAGFDYAVESMRYILFSECSRLNFSADVYTYLAKKFDTTPAGVDNALRRYVKHIWSNGEALKDNEFFPECAAGDERPLVSDFIFEMCDRIFYKYRHDFYRYFSEIHK